MNASSNYGYSNSWSWLVNKITVKPIGFCLPSIQITGTNGTYVEWSISSYIYPKNFIKVLL